MLDGLRVPARFVGRADVAASRDGSLIVTGFEPRPPGPKPAEFVALICDGGVHHYFHFIEALIWLVALHRQFLPGATLTRIVFAWPWDNPGQNHVQRRVLAAVYPGVAIADPGWSWPDAISDVLVIDRSWRQTGINKFLEAAMGFASPWAMLLGRIARDAVGVGEQAAPLGQRLRILHVRRPPPRALTAAAETALLALLGEHGEVLNCDFAAIPWEQQVRLSAAHDVMVGVHGNGLTNAVWMRPGGLVLELFPDGVRHYDYQLIAELCGLGYFGFERDRVFPAFSRTGEPYGHQAPTMQPVASVPLAGIARILTSEAARRQRGDGSDRQP